MFVDAGVFFPSLECFTPKIASNLLKLFSEIYTWQRMSDKPYWCATLSENVGNVSDGKGRISE